MLSPLQVPYVKAMDIWLCACLVFVVLAFVEFAIVHILTRWANEAHARIHRYTKQEPHKPSIRLDTNKASSRSEQVSTYTIIEIDVFLPFGKIVHHATLVLINYLNYAKLYRQY